MKPVFQDKFGAEGNCWPACLASLLELSLDEVKHLSCEWHPDWIKRTEEFLAKRGLYWVEVPLTDGAALPTLGIPHGAYLIVGLNRTGGRPHVVVGRFDHVAHHEDGTLKDWQLMVVHDPSIRGELRQDYRAEALIFLCKLHRDAAPAHERPGAYTWRAMIGGGAGPDVWDNEVYISAVDFADASKQAQGIAEECCGAVFLLETA